MKTNIVTYTFIFNMVAILTFSVIYSLIPEKNFEPLHPHDKLTYLDFLFYAVTIQSGIGLPDVTAVTDLAKFLAIIQQLTLMASAFILFHFIINR